MSRFRIRDFEYYERYKGYGRVIIPVTVGVAGTSYYVYSNRKKASEASNTPEEEVKEPRIEPIEIQPIIVEPVEEMEKPAPISVAAINTEKEDRIPFTEDGKLKRRFFPWK
jgi:hypothetical protein